MHTKSEYTRFLPHYHRVGHSFFVTFRLYDSLPRNFVEKLSRWFDTQKKEIELMQELSLRQHAEKELQRNYFKQIEEGLDKSLYGPVHLNKPEVAEVVTNELLRFDQELYQIWAYTLMPNHVHMLLDFSIQVKPGSTSNHSDYKNLNFAMQRIKGASARSANLILKNTGNPFWQPEYFDRYIRDERHFNAVVNYIKLNPVAAGLVDNWWEHPYTWVAEGLL